MHKVPASLFLDFLNTPNDLSRVFSICTKFKSFIENNIETITSKQIFIKQVKEIDIHKPLAEY